MGIFKNLKNKMFQTKEETMVTPTIENENDKKTIAHHTPIEDILYVKYRVKEQEQAFSINKGNNAITLENIKSFFEESKGDVYGAGVGESRKYLRGFGLKEPEKKFESIDWESILNLPKDQRNDIIDMLDLHSWNWGGFYLTAIDDKLVVKANQITENAFIYIMDEISDGTLTTEDIRNAIATMKEEDYPDICFEDLSQSKDYRVKRIANDETKFYLKDLQKDDDLEL